VGKGAKNGRKKKGAEKIKDVIAKKGSIAGIIQLVERKAGGRTSFSEEQGHTNFSGREEKERKLQAGKRKRTKKGHEQLSRGGKKWGKEAR